VKTLLFCQLALLVYHQVTTIFDFHPFNGARNYTWKEKLGEAGVNGVLMSLPPIGFGFHIRGLMNFGVVYYFVLLFIIILIWWVPYLTMPSGRWRAIYNFLLSCATSDFGKGDVSARWLARYNQLHLGTITFLPDRGDRVVPNLEHTILLVWTLITALVTAGACFHF
jgi:hypothetical protein